MSRSTPAVKRLSAMPKGTRKLAEVALAAGWKLTFHSNQYSWATRKGTYVLTTNGHSDQYLGRMRDRLRKAGLNVGGKA